MINRHSNLTLTDKLSREFDISETHSLILRKTYTLLSLAVIGMMVGGKIGISSPVILNLFFGWTGWILAMIALNAVPMIAMKFKDSPAIGTFALFMDGLIAGLVISPMLFIAERMAGFQIVTSAAWITLAIFLAVTGYVYFSKTRWAPSRAIYFGLFFAIIGAVVLNMFLNMGFLGILIAAAIGAFGVITLVSATSEILYNRELSSPVPGALMLFSSIFMIFQAVMHLLMAFSGRSDD